MACLQLRFGSALASAAPIFSLGFRVGGKEVSSPAPSPRGDNNNSNNASGNTNNNGSSGNTKTVA